MKPLRLVLLLAIAATPSANSLSDPLDETWAVPHDGLVWGMSLGGAGLVAGLGVLYYLGVGGLRHVGRENVLDHPMRTALLDTIRSSPGIHLRELASSHETAVTNTQWHLRKLEQAGLVKTQKIQGRRLYYPVAGGQAMRVLAVENATLRNPNAHRLSDFLQTNPGASQRALAEHLGMNPGTVRWHLRKMESAGLVRAIHEGSQPRYFVMRPAEQMPRSTEVSVAAQPAISR